MDAHQIVEIVLGTVVAAFTLIIFLCILYCIYITCWLPRLQENSDNTGCFTILTSDNTNQSPILQSRNVRWSSGTVLSSGHSEPLSPLSYQDEDQMKFDAIKYSITKN